MRSFRNGFYVRYCHCKQSYICKCIYRVVFDAYLAFANEVNYAIEQAEEPDDLDWGKIIQGTVFDPILTYCSSGVQEWIAEGIRCARLQKKRFVDFANL